MNWDILDLDPDEEWEHLQILQRLHDHNIDCVFVDMWFDDIVVIIGCTAGSNAIAYVLNIPKRVIYNDYDHGFVIINLYQLKAIRAGVDDRVTKYELYGE